MIDNVMGEPLMCREPIHAGERKHFSPGVTLKDTYIAGDLYLTESAGSDIKLIEVKSLFQNLTQVDTGSIV